MRRRLALRAEVVEHAAEPGAEELLPEPVHEDAGGERVLPGDDPVREVEPREPPRPGIGDRRQENGARPGSTTAPVSSCQLPRGKTRVVSGFQASVISVQALPSRHSSERRARR